VVLELYTNTFGPSGGEKPIRDVIKDTIAPLGLTTHTDALGNLHAYQNPEARGPRLMVAAHMDEVALIISSIDRSGLLKFNAIGMDPRVLVSKPVLVGPKAVPGVIGAKAIHLQRPEERQQVIPVDQLYIDIGAKSKEDAEKMVSRGDYACFITKYEEFGDGMVKAKALDDRAGCYVLTELLREQHNTPIFGVFTVQEELGLRGAGVAAYDINPDMAIVLEGTTCSDVPGAEQHMFSTVLGEGPAITLMDTSVITNQKMVSELVRLAEENHIPYQFKRTVTGGTDAGRIAQTRAGVPSVVIAVPCRYIHSPVSIASKKDVENAVKLVKLFVRRIEEGGFSL
jgi:endoglucanase